MQTWDTLEGNWKNIIKTVYTYGTISIATIKTAPVAAPALETVFRWNPSGVQITIPPSVQVSSIVLYDLRGSVVCRYVGAALKQDGDHFSLSLGAAAPAVGVIAVQTNRGVQVARRTMAW